MSDVSVGFTGTQEGMTEHQYDKVRILLIELTPREARHGMCIGADEQFHDICRELGIYIIGHPGIDKDGKSSKRGECDVDEIKPELPYLERNAHIVKESQILIATPKGFYEELRSGTWSTIRKARKKNRTTFIILPDGNMSNL